MELLYQDANSHQSAPARARRGDCQSGARVVGTVDTYGRDGNIQEIKDMQIKATHTLEELQEAAREQDLRIEEKDGKYRIVRTLSERFGLIGVKAGAGFSLNHNEVRKFLIFDSKRIDIGARLTDWS